MGKSVVNPVYEQSARAAYAKGGFRPRRKGERRLSYDLVPTFPNQRGQVSPGNELGPNTIASVQYLGTFLGYGHHAEELTYRAFVATLLDGQRVPMYSRDGDEYVMCLHTGFKE